MEEGEAAAVAALWERCGLLRPWNDPAADIALARRSSEATILVAQRADTIIGTVMVGHDGHRGALYYLAVDPGEQRAGIGAMLVAEAERWLTARGVAKLNLMVRPENEAVGRFYEALGFAREERIVYAKPLV